MKPPQVLAVIPARLGSTRFPGKVMHHYHGKPLLFWVYRDIAQCRLIDKVVIATDDKDIMHTMTALGSEVIRTETWHKTGSDRIAEAAEKIGGKIVLNVQADNFGLSHVVLSRVIRAMQEDTSIHYATLARRIRVADELDNPNTVKLVTSKDNQALWFSRSPMPIAHRANGKSPLRDFPYYAHIGVYFFRRAALRRFAGWPQSIYERAESLEQLRILENGEQIRVFVTSARIVSVETPQDVQKLDQLYSLR
jgi:3-deoxy-manno-octulosonate cytidylyltransferase (CMP-KDO synthetase)